MTWFESKSDWYRYWDGPEMIEFRAPQLGPLPDPDRVRLGTTRSPPARSARRSRWSPEPEPEPEPTPQPPRAALAQPSSARADAQRQLEPEALVGVVERVAEQLAQPRQAVARGLRVDAEPLARPGPGAPARPATPGGSRSAAPSSPPAARPAAPAGRRRAPSARRSSLRNSSSPACSRATTSAGRRRRASSSAAARSGEADPRLRASRPSSRARPRAPASVTARSSSGPPPGPVGVGHQRAGQLADRLGDRVRWAGARPRPRGAVAADRDHRERPRQRPAGLGGGRLDGGRGSAGGSRTSSPHQPAAPQLGLAGGRRLLERVPLGRLGREHVDVGEDRLRQQVQRLGLESGRHAGRREPPPGDAGADPVGAEQRVEAAPGAHLAPAERRVDVRAGDRPAGLDLGQEVAAAPPARPPGCPRRTARRAAARTPGTVRDRLDHLVGDVGQRRPQDRRDLRGQLVPGLIGHHFIAKLQVLASPRTGCVGETCAHATYPRCRDDPHCTRSST